MKIPCSPLLAVLSLASGVAAFAPLAPRSKMTSTSLFAVNGQDPELQAAIEEVRAAASEFSEETLAFANRWIDNMLEGKRESPAGVLEECVLDDDAKCERYSEALTKLDNLLGVGMKEQF